MRRYKVSVTTAADGSAIVYTPFLTGEVHSIHYVKGDFANGVDLAVTSEKTGENIWTEADVNASAVRYPRAPTHTQAGVASLYAAGGAPVQSRIGLAADRLKIAVSQGGNAKTGTFHILVA